MELYNTSDTPFAAVLLGLGYICSKKGINSHNGRMWFGFKMHPGVADNLESQWYGDAEDDDLQIETVCLGNLNIAFELKRNLVRVTKGEENDPRLTSKTWDDNYQA